MEEETEKKIVIESKRKEYIQIFFLILLFFAIVGLVACVITVYGYKEMLSNPLGYNLEQYELQACSCINNKGQIVEITSTNPLGNSTSFFSYNRPNCSSNTNHQNINLSFVLT